MTSHDSDVLIIGAGAAGHSAATTLRRDGFDGTVRVVHDEPVAPYNRTLVDKGILPGLLTPVQAALPSLASLGVEIVSGKASAIDPAERLVRLADATELPFRSLLLAVGSTPRPVLRNGEVEGVFPLHRAVDAQQIRSHVGSDFAGRVVTVLGAGLVGTEAASVFTASGARVHLVARSEVPLVSALGTPVATRLRDLHREHTIFHGGRTVTALRRTARGIEVHLDDAQVWESDLVVTAQGTTPATAWVPSGSAGVTVDASLRVEGLPHVYAAGGAVLHPSPGGGRIRIDHWDDAVAQGAHAARALLHDVTHGNDPGHYRPISGYSVNIYGSSLNGVGTARPGTSAHTVPTDDGGLVTTFTDSDALMTGAVGWRASRVVHQIRQELALRP